jgi:hypothetical protein
LIAVLAFANLGGCRFAFMIRLFAFHCATRPRPHQAAS